MPNCDFYALRDDLAAVLEFIFGETQCKVYQKDSRPGEEIMIFDNVDDILAEYDKGVGPLRVLLNLYSRTMNGNFKISKIHLNPEKFALNPWRYEATGWGAIQLFLGGPVDNGIYASHTNHNTEARASKWEKFGNELGPVSDWNWKEVTRISKRINRYIRQNLAVSKMGSKPILKNAFEAVESGRYKLL